MDKENSKYRYLDNIFMFNMYLCLIF